MRNEPKVLLMMLFIAGRCAAEPIRFEQIPAGAAGYVHVDWDRVMSSRLLAHFIDPKEAAARIEKESGGQLASITLYSRAGGGGTSKFVVLLRARGEKFFQKVEADSSKARDAVVFSYGNQKVYFSSAAQLEPTMEEPTTRPAGDPEPVYDKPLKKNGSYFTLGMGSGGSGDVEEWMRGPSYRAFIGQDLIVATTDLKSMAEALDVLAGKSPSLAREDPRGLKGTFLPGAMVVGAGLTAGFGSPTGEPPSTNRSTTQPTLVNPAKTGGFGLDLFGSFTGKAQLTWFDMGEDDNSEYVHVAVGMADAQSAEQLKNLIVGVTALATLSQFDQKSLFAPLLVRVEKTNVILEWNWPTAKLDDLASLVRSSKDEHDTPATNPTPGSAR